MPVKQVALKVAIKVQLSEVIVQAVLLKDEKLSDHSAGQAQVKRVVPAVDEIRKGLTAEQLQEPVTKTKLRAGQPPPPAIPILPTAHVRRVLRGRNGPRASGPSGQRLYERPGSDDQGQAGLDRSGAVQSQ